MVDFSIRVEGLEKVRDSFEKLPENLSPAITRALVKVASEAVEQIQSLINDTFPPPSPPFTPPHRRTGALVRSVRIESVEDNRVTVAIVGKGSGVPYAGMLEFGTSKMEPRPFVEPIAERITSESVVPVILEEINNELESAVK